MEKLIVGMPMAVVKLNILASGCDQNLYLVTLLTAYEFDTDFVLLVLKGGEYIPENAESLALLQPHWYELAEHGLFLVHALGVESKKVDAKGKIWTPYFYADSTYGGISAHWVGDKFEPFRDWFIARRINQMTE